MKSHPKMAAAVAVLAASAVAGFALRAFAFDNPLTSTAIRDAYFLGNRNDEQTGEFLSQYIHAFPKPESGAYVQRIGIETPFSQIIWHSRGKLNYFAPDAVEEFQNKSLPFLVHVEIALTESYAPVPPAPAPEYYQWVPDFWNDFEVKLAQDNQEIPAEEARGGPIYAYGANDLPIVTGAMIQRLYDPQKIKAEPTQITVLTPDGQTVETTFDLGKLR